MSIRLKCSLMRYNRKLNFNTYIIYAKYENRRIMFTEYYKSLEHHMELKRKMFTFEFVKHEKRERR